MVDHLLSPCHFFSDSGLAVKKRPFSPAEWTGGIALFACLPLWMADPRLAMVPLVGFILLCFVMPFMPRMSFFLPVISRGKTSQPVVGLTFDDGPDPLSTPPLLRVLEKHGAIATFFVIGERSRRYPDLVREIISRGHSIGNHSYSHDDYLMFRGTATIVQEIETTQQVLRELGFLPRLFRPPVGITTPRYAPAIHQTGLQVVNFSRRAGDMGNRRVQGICRRILEKLRADDIILLHDIPPRGGADLQEWLVEVESLLLGIKGKGLAIVPLETLIGQPVMIKLS
jgi:peptidoglycan-N-acetylglucosamine deacetylase